MAKRFTDSDKWKKEWFCDLSNKMKVAWIYLVDNCDHAGIWDINMRLMSFMIGEDISEDELRVDLGKQLSFLPNNRVFIPSFISFQYGQLRDSNRVHLSVIAALKRNGLNPDVASGLSQDPRAIMDRLSRAAKDAIFAEDCFRCSYCGVGLDHETAKCDHIVARNHGGQNNIENLTTSCAPCNGKKSDSDVFVFIARRDIKFNLSKNLIGKLLLLDPSNSLIAPYKNLLGAKDKDKDQEEDKDSSLNTERCNIEREATSVPEDKLPGLTSVQDFDSRFHPDVQKVIAVSRDKFGKRLARYATKIIDHWGNFANFETWVINVEKSYKVSPKKVDLEAWVEICIKKELGLIRERPA